MRICHVLRHFMCPLCVAKLVALHIVSVSLMDASMLTYSLVLSSPAHDKPDSESQHCQTSYATACATYNSGVEAPADDGKDMDVEEVDGVAGEEALTFTNHQYTALRHRLERGYSLPVSELSLDLERSLEAHTCSSHCC